MADKKQELNYRESDNGRECEDCTRFDSASRNRCDVIGTGVAVKYKIEPDGTCDAWNDMDENNTWYLATVRDGKEAFFQIYDVQVWNNGEQERVDLGVTRIDDATTDLPGKIFTKVKELVREHGAPDEFVNLNGEAVFNAKMKKYLQGIGIDYRYMKNETEDIAEEKNQGLTALDLLSIEIDSYLQSGEGS
jgi:hypothetical protein